MFELYATQASFSSRAARTMNYKLNSLALGTPLKEGFALLKSPYIFSCIFFLFVSLIISLLCLSFSPNTGLPHPGGADLQRGHLRGKIIPAVLKPSQPSPEAIPISCPPRVRQHNSLCYCALKWFSVLCSDISVRIFTADVFLETQRQRDMVYQASYSAPEETESQTIVAGCFICYCSFF